MGVNRLKEGVRGAGDTELLPFWIKFDGGTLMCNNLIDFSLLRQQLAVCFPRFQYPLAFHSHLTILLVIPCFYYPPPPTDPTLSYFHFSVTFSASLFSSLYIL